MNLRTTIAVIAAGVLWAGTAFEAAAGSKSKGCPSKDIEADYWTTTKSIDGLRYTYSWFHEARNGEVIRAAVSFEPFPGFVPGDAMRHLAGRPLKESDANYVLMAEEDPYRRTFIRPLVEAVVSEAERMGESPIALMLSLIQGIPYRCGPYQLWPTEVLLNMHGDCSDTSVALAALVEQFQATRVGELGVAPFWVYVIDNVDRHMALAVRVGKRDAPGDGARTRFRTVKGTRYYYAESTGTSWSIGERPDSLAEGARVLVPRSWRQPRRSVAAAPHAPIRVVGGPYFLEP